MLSEGSAHGFMARVLGRDITTEPETKVSETKQPFPSLGSSPQVFCCSDRESTNQGLLVSRSVLSSASQSTKNKCLEAAKNIW